MFQATILYNIHVLYEQMAVCRFSWLFVSVPLTGLEVTVQQVLLFQVRWWGWCVSLTGGAQTSSRPTWTRRTPTRARSSGTSGRRATCASGRHQKPQLCIFNRKLWNFQKMFILLILQHSHLISIVHCIKGIVSRDFEWQQIILMNTQIMYPRCSAEGLFF